MSTADSSTHNPTMPYQLDDDLLQSAKNIKLAVFDVDGVLTDGKLYYGEKGETIKVFNALDGHGLKMLQNAGILVAIITARDCTALRTRMQDLGIRHCYYGVKDKRAVFEQLIAEKSLNAKQCCYLGDDIIDLQVMRQCGLKFAVENAHYTVKHYADWITPQKGGNGAARAVCDIILTAQGAYPF